MRNFSKRNQLIKMLRWRVPKLGFLPMDYLKDKIRAYVPYEKLEDLPRKVMIGGTNLETGRHEDIETGYLTKAVTASCAIAVFFRPVELDRQSTRLNSSHVAISYAVSCLNRTER